MSSYLTGNSSSGSSASDLSRSLLSGLSPYWTPPHTTPSLSATESMYTLFYFHFSMLLFCPAPQKLSQPKFRTKFLLFFTSRSEVSSPELFGGGGILGQEAEVYSFIHVVPFRFLVVCEFYFFVLLSMI